MSKKVPGLKRTPRGIESLVKKISRMVEEWVKARAELGLSVRHKGANVIVAIGHRENLLLTKAARAAAPPLITEQKRQIKEFLHHLVKTLQLHIRQLNDFGSQMVCSLATG